MTTWMNVVSFLRKIRKDIYSLSAFEVNEIYSISGESVLWSTGRSDIGVLAPCTHEDLERSWPERWTG